MKLRSHLIILVVAALLPVLIFAGVMLFLFSRQQRTDVENGLRHTARALSLAVDRELQASIRTLEALATSEHLDLGNLKQFYEQANRVLKTQPYWNTIVLFDPEARQILNLLRPFGSPLPTEPAGDPGVKNTIELKQPLISNLFFGRVARELRIAVNVPVIRKGQAKYLLASAARPTFLVKLLKEQNIPAEWLATVIDRNKKIIAQTWNSDNPIGKLAAARFAAKSEEQEVAWRDVLDKGETRSEERRVGKEG